MRAKNFHRHILYDLTHLIARLRANAGTGIDRVDLAFAKHFCVDMPKAQAVRYGLRSPQSIRADLAERFIHAAESVWVDPAPTSIKPLWGWLDAEPQSGARFQPNPQPDLCARSWSRWLLSFVGYISGNPYREVPQGAVYINVAYHRFEHPRFFSWLARRRDVQSIFLIHDLLPLDYPECFHPDEALKFRTRITTALTYGRAFLVSTAAVKQRLLEEMTLCNYPSRPILVLPFPSPLADFASHTLARHRSTAAPYFVIIGTIEPRKNHLLLLNIWRDLVTRGQIPPRLVIVGKRGWENEQVLDLLDRCKALAPYVAEVSDVPAPELVQLIRGARAVLSPSFDEGYGLPIVEALALGVPVIASDIPVAREVSQGRAQFFSPLDGKGWMEAILRLANEDSHFQDIKAHTAGFVAPSWDTYFSALEDFLSTLQ